MLNWIHPLSDSYKKHEFTLKTHKSMSYFSIKSKNLCKFNFSDLKQISCKSGLKLVHMFLHIWTKMLILLQFFWVILVNLCGFIFTKIVKVGDFCYKMFLEDQTGKLKSYVYFQNISDKRRQFNRSSNKTASFVVDRPDSN